MVGVGVFREAISSFGDNCPTGPSPGEGDQAPDSNPDVCKGHPYEVDPPDWYTGGANGAPIDTPSTANAVVTIQRKPMKHRARNPHIITGSKVQVSKPAVERAPSRMAVEEFVPIPVRKEE